MNKISLSAVMSVARKEFLHILRDRRVLVLLLILPPFFTLMFGHAFEVGDPTDIPGLLIDRDQTEQSQRFVEVAKKKQNLCLAIRFPDHTKRIGLDWPPR